MGLLRDALAEQLGSDPAALGIVLSHKAQAAALRQIRVKRDARDMLFRHLVDLCLDCQIVECTERDPLRAPAEQFIQQINRLDRNVALAGAHTHLCAALGQHSARRVDPAGDLIAERTRPVGQHDAQTHRRQLLAGAGLPVCLARGQIADLADRIEYALAHIRADIGTVVEHTVDRAARNPGAFGHHLDRWTFVHFSHLPVVFLIIAQILCFVCIKTQACSFVCAKAHTMCFLSDPKTRHFACPLCIFAPAGLHFSWIFLCFFALSLLRMANFSAKKSSSFQFAILLHSFFRVFEQRQAILKHFASLIRTGCFFLPFFPIDNCFMPDYNEHIKAQSTQTHIERERM